jgi:hypothetical protein
VTYARQLGWLHATPEKASKSRMSEYTDSNIEPPLPDVEGAFYLVKALLALGLSESNGMGSVPVSWGNIKAWADATQTDLSPFELETLFQMSKNYANELNIATDPKRPAPYINLSAERIEQNRSAVADKLKNIFQSRIKTTEGDVND